MRERHNVYVIELDKDVLYEANGTLFGLGYDHPLDKNTNLRFAWTEYKKVAGEDINARFLSVGAIYKY